MKHGILHTSIIQRALTQIKTTAHKKIQVMLTLGLVLSPGVDELSDLQTILDTDTTHMHIWFAHTALLIVDHV